MSIIDTFDFHGEEIITAKQNVKKIGSLNAGDIY